MNDHVLNLMVSFVFLVVGNCTFGEMRIVGGQDEYEGRVEICIGGEWGTVCNENWDISDARVACRQLGYTDTGQFFTTCCYSIKLSTVKSAIVDTSIIRTSVVIPLQYK